jgi:hypothetical protein
MASPSLQIQLEGGGRGGTGDPTREILRMNKALRKSRERRRRDPSTIASIPSRYQVFFHRSTQAKGFSSQSSRFQEHLNFDDSPGPGSYTTTHSSLDTHPMSSSTAGSGGFASKSVRFRGERGSRVGPGLYDPCLQPPRHDFSYTNVSRLFQTPIAVAPEERGTTGPVSPSPTSYHPSHCHTRTSHLVSAEAAFKSRSKRSSLSSSTTLTPSPGHYTVRDHFLHPSPSSHSSVFTSKCHRGIPHPSSVCPNLRP